MTKKGLVVKGTSVSPGMAHGVAYVLEAAGDGTPVPRRTIAAAEVESELARLDTAIVRAERELLDLQVSVAENLGEAESEIFGAHAMLVRSPSLQRKVRSIVREQRVNVEAALAEVIVDLMSSFDAIRDETLHQRKADVSDIGRRILSALLLEQGSPCGIIPEDAILVADELRPSFAATLDLCRVRGVVTERGGKFGHAAMLARSSSMPAVFGVPEATQKISTGDRVAIDAVSGTVYVNAGKALEDEFDRLEAEADAFREELQLTVDEPSVTLDGTRIVLTANVSDPADAELALLHKAEGIGLYRTEFGFTTGNRFPTEDEQLHFLERAAAAVNPHKVVLRLLDIGGDKQLDYHPLPAAVNPALARRGIRLLLASPEILHRQLRAFLRLGASHPVWILLPVVTDLEEVRRTREALRLAAAELSAEGAEFAANVPMGVMLEVPSAALLVDRLAREVDFFSLGTNDLIQYLLAADREDQDEDSGYQPLNPAVLQLISSVAASASAANRSLSICGEVAGDPLFTELLIGLGLREMSVAPRSLLEVKRAVRGVRVADAEALARRALALGTATEVEAVLEESRSTARLQV